ncbi:hypothetical protein LIER_37998 [Lithospermum erythrorhizon]|uniref:Uncharacterized protein n=1 Tax=Lithospermum erythrorhizon TaxID=34254 RepID=A0AAV3PW84_LITER
MGQARLNTKRTQRPIPFYEPKTYWVRGGRVHAVDSPVAFIPDMPYPDNPVYQQPPRQQKSLHRIGGDGL